jgi:hypothetical protein
MLHGGFVTQSDHASKRNSLLACLPSIVVSFSFVNPLIKCNRLLLSSLQSVKWSILKTNINSRLYFAFIFVDKIMIVVESSTSRWFHIILPICFICFLYLCSFYLFVCATNSLIYSTVCLLHTNESFCSEIDRNKSQEFIQKESSQWSLYGTLSFTIVALFISPIYGSLSDTKDRK